MRGPYGWRYAEGHLDEIAQIGIALTAADLAEGVGGCGCERRQPFDDFPATRADVLPLHHEQPDSPRMEEQFDDRRARQAVIRGKPDRVDAHDGVVAGRADDDAERIEQPVVNANRRCECRELLGQQRQVRP